MLKVRTIAAVSVAVGLVMVGAGAFQRPHPKPWGVDVGPLGCKSVAYGESCGLVVGPGHWATNGAYGLGQRVRCA